MAGVGHGATPCSRHRAIVFRLTLTLRCAQGGPSLRSAHFYRKVPKELTEGTALGGIVSLVGIVVSVLLVYSNAVM